MAEKISFDKLYEFIVQPSRTEEEYVERYEEFGFTKKDYEETKGLIEATFALWEVPELAARKGVKPQELVATLILRTFGRNLVFPYREVYGGE